MAHSSSGLGRWPLTSVTGVQIPYALQIWSVYVLRSLKDGRCYVGMSEDVSQRLKTHNLGKVTSTKSRRPFELIYTQECCDRETARKLEKYLKTSAGKRWLNKQISNRGSLPD